jgi:membrane protease YdiL (CAAX protease family)
VSASQVAAYRMTHAPPSPKPPRWVGPALIMGYIFLSLLWVISISAALVWRMVASGTPLDQLDTVNVIAVLGPAGFAAQSILQATGFVAIAAGLVALLNRVGKSAWHTRYRDTFAMRRCSPQFIAIGLIGGLFVGIFPGQLVDELRSQYPDLDLGTLDVITQLFAAAEGPSLALLCATLVIVAPVTEELVFRGYLWSASDRMMPAWAVWLTTSLLFSLYHMSLIQSLALLFTGSFIGFLRWTSGSIWPAIAAHGSNNLLATIAVWSGTIAGDGGIPWWSAFASGLLTLGLCGYAWRIRRLE